MNRPPLSSKAPQFVDIANAMIDRGFKVVPVHPGQKRPILEAWTEKATNDRAQIERWGREFPNANCGIVADVATHWMLDVDDPVWFVANCPEAPHTFSVKTGGGGFQFWFTQDEASRTRLGNKSLPNPKRAEEGEKENLLECKFTSALGIAPGSVHPNGKRYEIQADEAVVPASKTFLDWISQTMFSTHNASSYAVRSRLTLKPGTDAEAVLKSAGLKFRRKERDGKVYFNYHEEMGRCLVKGVNGGVKVDQWGGAKLDQAIS